MWVLKSATGGLLKWDHVGLAVLGTVIAEALFPGFSLLGAAAGATGLATLVSGWTATLGHHWGALSAVEGQDETPWLSMTGNLGSIACPVGSRW